MAMMGSLSHVVYLVIGSYVSLVVIDQTLSS